MAAASASKERTLPDRSDDFATCIAAAPSCLVLGTQRGALQFFSLTDWEPLSGVEYRHSREIRAVFPNRTGAHVLFVDAELNGYMYSPVTGAAVLVPDFAKGYTNVMWDAADWGVFAVAEPRSIHTYLYSPSSMTGPRVTHLGPLTIQSNGDMNVDPRPTRVPGDHSPILSYDGVVVAQVASGALGAVVLGTHKPLLTVRAAALRAQQPWCHVLRRPPLTTVLLLPSSLTTPSPRCSLRRPLCHSPCSACPRSSARRRLRPASRCRVWTRRGSSRWP